MAKCYVDSNVLLSYFKRELGGITQIQMIRTEEFLVNCSENSHKLVLSDLTFDEVHNNGYLTQDEVEDILDRFGVNFMTVDTTQTDVNKARDIGRRTTIHWPDSLHTRLALKSKSNVIVTWNMRDFQKVARLIDVCKPDEFI